MTVALSELSPRVRTSSRNTLAILLWGLVALHVLVVLALPHPAIASRLATVRRAAPGGFVRTVARAKGSGPGAGCVAPAERIDGALGSWTSGRGAGWTICSRPELCGRSIGLHRRDCGVSHAAYDIEHTQDRIDSNYFLPRQRADRAGCGSHVCTALPNVGHASVNRDGRHLWGGMRRTCGVGGSRGWLTWSTLEERTAHPPVGRGSLDVPAHLSRDELRHDTTGICTQAPSSICSGALPSSMPAGRVCTCPHPRSRALRTNGSATAGC